MNRAIAVAGAVVIGGALVWYFAREARWPSEIRQLSSLLEAELVEYEAPRPRPPFGSPTLAGDAGTAYAEALAACDELEPGTEWMVADPSPLLGR